MIESGGRIEGAGQGLDNICRNDSIQVIALYEQQFEFHPSRLPGDTNARLVQMEVLMN